MSVEMVSRAIQLIVAPVVMVTACAILASGLMSHYATINDRLRLMTRERLDLLRLPPPDSNGPIDRERLTQIDSELPRILARHTQVRDALTALYLGTALFLVTMLALAVATATGSIVAAQAGLVLFLGGVAVLGLGVAITVVEIHGSNDAVRDEVSRVLALRR